MLTQQERDAIHFALHALRDDPRLKTDETPVTQERIGTALGLSQEAVGKAFRNRSAGPGVLRALCAYLGMTTEQLVAKYAPGEVRAASADERYGRDVMNSAREKAIKKGVPFAFAAGWDGAFQSKGHPSAEAIAEQIIADWRDAKAERKGKKNNTPAADF